LASNLAANAETNMMREAVQLTLLVVLFAAASAGGAAADDDRVGILDGGPQAGHYLTWRGRPIMPIGDSVTQGWMESGTNFDTKAYIDTLASHGINVVLLWSYIATSAATQEADARLGYDAPEVGPWTGSADKADFDLLEFNPAYFERLKELVAYAEKREILIVITVHDGWPKTRFGQHPFNEKLGNGPLSDRSQFVDLADYDREMPRTFDPDWNRRQKSQFFQERFAERLIDGLNGCSNVIFEMFNEGEWYDKEKRRRHEEHFLRFFRKRTKALLMTNTDHITGDDPRNSRDVDILGFHPMGWTGKFKRYEGQFHGQPARPLFQSEPVPEFDGTNLSLDTVRASLWERVLSGTAWVAQNDTSFGFDSKCRMAARSAERDETYRQIGYAARYLHQSGVPFWRMGPDSRLSSTGICLAEPGRNYLVYAPGGGKFTVDLSAGAGEEFAVQWFNPRNGKAEHGKGIVATSRTSFHCPDGQDWVLWLSLRGEGASPR
jgi:hypothetical protein